MLVDGATIADGLAKVAISWLTVLLFLHSTASADPSHAPHATGDQATDRSAETEPYCGISCLYAAMRACGRDSSMEALLKPEYISSTKGSSIADLLRAARDQSLHASALDGMTWSMLLDAKAPIILYVKANPASANYDHYCVALGRGPGESIKLLDPPDSVEFANAAMLARRWSGRGIIIDTEPIAMTHVAAAGYRSAAIFAVLILGTMGVVVAADRWWGGETWRSPRIAGSRSLLFLSLLTAAVLAFVGYNALVVSGLLRDQNWRSVERARRAIFLERLSDEELQRRLTGGDIIVDARAEADFLAGHIPRSINIPVNTPAAERRQRLPGTRDAEIIVYCQSMSCMFAEDLAAKLMEDGYRNISLYPGGWKQWEALGRKQGK